VLQGGRMRTYRWTSLLLVAALFAAGACVLPTVAITDPNAQATMLAVTVNAAVADTQIAAGTPPTATLSPTVTYTPTVTSTETPTPTPTLTQTPYVILTFTPLIPMISVSVNTNCREGPSTIYNITGALLVGQTVQIYAQDPTGTWWQIKDPSGREYCWVSGKYATTTGLTNTLPIYTPRPTPLPTYTPTPAPGFDLSYNGLVGCTTEWWPEITLDNTGDITFRSVEITVRDMVTSQEVSDDLNSFVDNYNCSSSTSRSTLLPDRSVTISSPSFTVDPTNHRLRTTITLCSERDLDGDCITETITAKP
jgi:uncharacterized protein YgiM (DUF1202 family)